MKITPGAAEFFFENGQTDARDVDYDRFLHVIFLCNTARVVAAHDMSILFPQVL